MHLQPLYRSNEIAGGAVAERLYRRSLCLPSGSTLTEADQERVVAALRRIVGDRSSPTVGIETGEDQNEAISATSGQSGDHAATG